MVIVIAIASWLLIVLLPAVLLFMIPLVGWILGIVWMILGTAACIEQVKSEM